MPRFLSVDVFVRDGTACPLVIYCVHICLQKFVLILTKLRFAWGLRKHFVSMPNEENYAQELLLKIFRFGGIFYASLLTLGNIFIFSAAGWILGEMTSSLILLGTGWTHLQCSELGGPCCGTVEEVACTQILWAPLHLPPLSLLSTPWPFSARPVLVCSQ